MPPARSVSAATARRFLAVRHLLAPPRSLPAEPESVMRVFDRIGSIQFDPLEVAGRNHDLVLLARVAGYERRWTDQLLYEERRLFEAYNKAFNLLPVSELPWYRLTWDRNRAQHEESTFREHAALVGELLDRIRSDGPLSSTDVEPRKTIEWYWRPTNQVRAILEALAESGILGIQRREGNRRVYDLVERLYPADLLARRYPEREQRRHRLLSRYRAHGLLGRAGNAELWYGTAPGRALGNGSVGVTRQELLDGLLGDGSLVPVAVEGVRGDRYALAEELPLLDAAAVDVEAGVAPGDPPGVAFLAPLDPLCWDRQLLKSLYGFDYVWEVYVPAARRRWGYYVLPIHFGHRLVGRIEPRIERRERTLRVVDLWWEDGFDPLAEPGFVDALADALEAHRRFGSVDRIVMPRTARHRALARALRAAGAATSPAGSAA